MSKKIRYETVGGIEFNDNRLYDDLEERCHMVYTANGDTYRCCEVSTHELQEIKIDHFNGHKKIYRRYCDQHTIQLKLSNDFKNNKFIKR